MAILGCMLIMDLVFFLWATIPFVPTGVDETQFAINAHVLAGAELPISWIRTPLPVCGAALVPWHPPLVGLLLRSGSILAVFALARGALGTSFALLAAFWTMVSGTLGVYSVPLLSEPYGAGLVVLFVLCVIARRWWLAALLGGLCFASRWHLGILLVPTLYCTFRSRGLVGALLAAVLFALPVSVLAPLTGSDPWRAFQQESQRPTLVLDRFLAYLEPESGFGLGMLGFVLLLLGMWSLRDRSHRHDSLVLAAAVFIVYAAGVMSLGAITTRFFAPVVPLGAMLMAAGTAAAVRRWPALAGAGWGGILLTLVSMSTALPARVPKSRFRTMNSEARVVRDHREHLLSHLGPADLYTDYNVLATTAVLGHRCHAVLGARSRHPEGVSLSFEGELPDVPRAKVPVGAFYLTFDPAGRAPLWQSEGLSLVRW